MAEDGSIIIDTELDNSGFMAGAKELLAAIRDVSASVNQLGDNMMTSFSKVIPLLQTIAANTATIQTGMQTGATATTEAAQQTEQAEQTVTDAANRATDAINRQTEASQVQQRTTQTTLDRAQAKIDAAKAKMAEYYRELEEIQNSTDEWLKSSTSSEQTTNILAIEEQQIEALNAKYASQLEVLHGLEEQYERMRQNMADNGTVDDEVADQLDDMADTATRAGSAFEGFGARIRTAAGSLLHFAGNLARISYRTITRGITKLISYIRQIGHHSQAATISTQGLIKGLLSIKTMLIGKLKSMFIKEVTEAIQNGLKALQQYSGKYNAAMNSIKNSATELGANLSVSLGNLITAIEPAMTAIINAVSRAISYLNALFALLRGKSTVTVAKKQMKDYGAATESAAGSAEKLNRQVYGFDQLNRRSSNSGGGGGGADDAQDLFEEIAYEDLLPESIQNFFDKIKKAFENQEWYNLGFTVGEGLNEAIKKIDDWINNTLRPRGVEWARRIAEILNGLTDGINWTLLGKTLADGINTVFDIANTFLTTYDFKNLGTKVGEAINSLVANTDWDLIGETLANRWNALIHFLEGVITKTDWGQIGDALAEGFNKFVKTLDLSSLSTVISGSINGITETITHFVDNVDWDDAGKKLADFISKTIRDIDFKKISSAISKIIKSAADFANSFLKNLDTSAMVQAIIDLVKGFDWAGVAKSIVQLLNTALITASKILNPAAWFLSEEQRKELYKEMDEVAEEAARNMNRYEAEFRGSGKTFGEALADSMTETLGEKIKNRFTAIRTIIEKAFPWLASTESTGAQTYTEEKDPVEAIEWRATQIKEYQKAMADAATARAAEEEAAAAKIQEAYERQHKAAVDSLRGQIDLWGEAADKHKVSIEQMIANIEKQRKANEDYLQNYAIVTQSEIKISDGLRAKLSENDDEAKLLAAMLAEALKQGNTELVQALSDEFEAYDRTSSKVLRTLENTKNGIITTFQGLAAQLHQMGEQAINGLIEGIDSRSGVAIQRISTLANDINKAYAVRAEIKSPSKVFERFGKYDVQGLEVGVEKRKPHAIRTIERLSDSVISAMGGLVVPKIAAGTTVPPKVQVSDDNITATSELALFTGSMDEYMSDTNFLLRRIIEILQALNLDIDADSLAAALTSAQRRTQRAYGGA